MIPDLKNNFTLSNADSRPKKKKKKKLILISFILFPKEGKTQTSYLTVTGGMWESCIYYAVLKLGLEFLVYTSDFVILKLIWF